MSLLTLVIDMQVDYFAHERLRNHRQWLVDNINRLVRSSRQCGAPVIWVKSEFTPDLHDAPLEVRRKVIPIVIAGTPGAQLLPELDRGSHDTVLIKKRYSAFFGTSLQSQLQALACSQLIVCGINTHACVRTTVVDAYQLDYQVILADSCIDSHDAEHHAISWRYMQGKLGEVLTVEAIIALLQRSTA